MLQPVLGGAGIFGIASISPPQASALWHVYPFGGCPLAQGMEDSRCSSVIGIATLVEGSRCRCRGCKVICKQISLTLSVAPSGGTPGWRVPVQGCGQVPLARSTALLAMAAPLRSAGHVSAPPQRNRTMPRGEEKNISDFIATLTTYVRTH